MLINKETKHGECSKEDEKYHEFYNNAHKIGMYIRKMLAKGIREEEESIADEEEEKEEIALEEEKEENALECDDNGLQELEKIAAMSPSQVRSSQD